MAERRNERAAQIWPLLTWAAHNRQILTYTILGKLIGVPQQGLGQLLMPIQSYCMRKELPALTSLVVDKDGIPGQGFIAAANVPKAQAEVFATAWLEEDVPTAEDFAESAE